MFFKMLKYGYRDCRDVSRLVSFISVSIRNYSTPEFHAASIRDVFPSLKTRKWSVAAMSICLACTGAAFALQPPCRLCCWLPAPQAAFCLSLGILLSTGRAGVSRPVFWRSPHNVTHATVDIGQMVEWISQQLQLEAGENGCLAVLHDRNDMTCALNSSDWVVNSKGKVISRGVTSCAGMTAQHVLLHKRKLVSLQDSTSRNFLPMRSNPNVKKPLPEPQLP